MDVKDAVEQLGEELHRVNADVRDQLQQLNERIDHATALISIVVERFSQGGQPIALSHSHMVAASPAPAASAGTCTVTVPIDEEQPQFEGAEGTSRVNLEEDHQYPPTESYIWRVILSPAYNRLQSLVE